MGCCMADIIKEAPNTEEGAKAAADEIRKRLSRTDTCNISPCPLPGGKTEANAKAEANRLGRPDIADLI